MKVTLGIPTYSRFHYLQEAVKSAQDQSYANVEILISDDGESEEISQWSQKVIKEDPRVRYIKNLKRRGLAGNWNSILENATGDYIGIIGDDDRYLPEFVKRMMEGIKEDADIIFSSHYLINNSGTRLIEETNRSEKRYFRDKLSTGFLSDPADWIWRNTVPMSSSIFRNPKGKIKFNEKLNTPEILFHLEYSQKGARYYFIPEFLLEFRVHHSSSTSSGLWTEKLVEALIEFKVETKYELKKEELISSMIVNAIGRALIGNENKIADKLIKSTYFKATKKSFLSKVILIICTNLPKPIGNTIYRILHFLKSMF